ncbi:hypothetical protein KIN20_037991 [Parelaphostrongylus tenuis]|uniref:Uncharacterized protein n=1 Tax=Parelaphostrongylus tenuis TaxID=148309 RepID=A0AAD5WLC3_PARTN|nr:hypothetical protein KIN20_037991 [Parelaphostrongylus tenuis]
MHRGADALFASPTQATERHRLPINGKKETVVLLQKTRLSYLNVCARKEGHRIKLQFCSKIVCNVTSIGDAIESIVELKIASRTFALSSLPLVVSSTVGLNSQHRLYGAGRTSA